MDYGSTGKSGWEGNMESNEVTDPSNKPLMRDYWAKFQKRTFIVIGIGQCSTMIFCFGILEILGITNVGWGMFIVLALASAAVLSGVTFLLVHMIFQPFRDLVKAIVLVSGEPSDSSPPNPNTYMYDRDGFKEILQTIYELAARRDEPSTPTVTLDTAIKTGVDSMKTGLVIMDNERNVVYHNDAAPIRIDSDNNPVFDLVFPEKDSITAWLNKAEETKLTSEKQWTRVSNKLPGDKGRRIFDIAASYHKNSSAETVITFFDRTNVYTPEEDELDFISFAAHELRGPITVIRGYLSVLEDELKPVLQQDQSELMQRLIVASNRLSSYINNILNASQYDRRHFKLHLNEETVRHMYDLISDDMQMRAQAQGRVLVIDIPEDLPTVAADANSIGEVMGNLIDNAIKYSNEGGLIHVVAHPIPGFIEVSVIDRGIGMPSNIIPNLFHKFYRSHRSRETVAGTGIGLYICKAIVSSHGGTITARSVENEGSTFSFTIPIYDTVAEKLKSGNNSNKSLIEHGSGWIRNHSLYRG